MKQNRDMFYSDYQAGSYSMPNNMMSPPNMWNVNSNMMAAGPNVIANQIPGQNYGYGYIEENEKTNELRISKLEKQVRRLESRLTRLETESGINLKETDDITINSNMYMI